MSEVRISLRTFKKKLMQILNSDTSYSHTTCNFPHAFLTIRSISHDHRYSDLSQSLYISANDVKFLRETEVEHRKDSSMDSGGESQTLTQIKVQPNKNIPTIEINADERKESWSTFPKSQNKKRNIHPPENSKYSRSQQYQSISTRLLNNYHQLYLDDDFSSDDTSTGTTSSRKQPKTKPCRCESQTRATSANETGKQMYTNQRSGLNRIEFHCT